MRLRYKKGHILFLPQYKSTKKKIKISLFKKINVNLTLITKGAESYDGFVNVF